MRLRIHHETVYEYPRPVANSVNEAWLRPLSDERQSCLSFRLSTTPRSQPRPYTDYFGNTVYHFDVQEPHARLAILAEAEVLTEPFDAAAALQADASPYEPLSPIDRDRWLDFLSPTPLTAADTETRAFAERVAAGRTTVAGLLLALADRVHAQLRYEPGSTAVTTTAGQALRLGSGVCQDYTHLFLAVCRVLGVPARYVSGYLCTGAGPDQTQASHAWAEALLPAAGWIGFDATNGRLADERYVRIAVGRDYADVPPVRGAYSGPAGAEPSVAVSVQSDQ
jgi:transglutaminase-like putative cysteine protease